MGLSGLGRSGSCAICDSRTHQGLKRSILSCSTSKRVSDKAGSVHPYNAKPFRYFPLRCFNAFLNGLIDPLSRLQHCNKIH